MPKSTSATAVKREMSEESVPSSSGRQLESSSQAAAKITTINPENEKPAWTTACGHEGEAMRGLTIGSLLGLQSPQLEVQRVQMMQREVKIGQIIFTLASSAEFITSTR